eukprot:CAMPEP_0181322106 /NCGR_PEP_ID=MMETSP1101-20121128/19051_1 /TAXON_ID=46948 /ORGANISM="Rhodomonas abbreviata, Strain Caron Lab Isolate" /LENGTH=708 /DNA_ID=CAMNT_0023429997 /DNA_START=120 /DNA_END=2243 /DNA_ORIENTATION=+
MEVTETVVQNLGRPDHDFDEGEVNPISVVLDELSLNETRVAEDREAPSPLKGVQQQEKDSPIHDLSDITAVLKVEEKENLGEETQCNFAKLGSSEGEISQQGDFVGVVNGIVVPDEPSIQVPPDELCEIILSEKKCSIEEEEEEGDKSNPDCEGDSDNLSGIWENGHRTIFSSRTSVNGAEPRYLGETPAEPKPEFKCREDFILFRCCATILLYIIPVAMAVFILQAMEAAVASQGHLLFAAFTSIRDASSWLGSLFTFFWFFEMSAVGKLLGEGNWQGIGGHMVLSSVCSFAGGTAAMITLLVLSEEILYFVSPPDTADAIKAIALLPQKVIAASLPFSVYTFGAAGLMLGLKNIARTVGLFFVWGAGGAIGTVVVLMRLNCRDEEFEFCPDGVEFEPEKVEGAFSAVTDCAMTYEKDGWICTSYQTFLLHTSIVFLGSSVGLAISLCYCHWQLIRVHSINIGAAIQSKEFLKDWSRDTGWVALRSILNSTRQFIALAAALRMGITEGAVFIMFNSVSQLAYAIPSNLASVAMITISRLIGKGQIAAAERVLKDYRIFALCCGAAFCALVVVYRSSIIASYSKEQEEEAFRDMVNPVWFLFVIYQPIKSLIAVYHALVAAKQEFVYWGKATSFSFFCVFLPFTLAAGRAERIDLLLGAEVAYSAVLLTCLYRKMHCEPLAREGGHACMRMVPCAVSKAERRRRKKAG